MQAPWGQVLQCRPLAAAVDHFFTAREISPAADDYEWKPVAAHVGVTPDDLLLLRQVHGAAVALAEQQRRRPWVRPEADTIATDDPDAAVAVQTADCVAILVAEETGRAVAAIHAGWRGLAKRAPIAGVKALLERYGVRPERLIAALGPCIGGCCYEVGAEVRQAFVEAGHHSAMLEQWFAPGGSGTFHLDTLRAAIDQLEGAGMQETRIHAANLCTRHHADVFHSYRAEGSRAGRMLAVVRPSRVRRHG